jgi:hypothetical protein
MSGYTKLFSSILASTIWEEDKDTRIVWITLLAMANRRGIAEGSVPGLATFARLSVDETRKALIKLSSPDPDSRSKEEDGRRIITVDGGWFIVNHKKYRDKLNEDERREYQASWQAQHRQKQAGAHAPDVDNVDNVDKMSTPLTQAAPDPTPTPDPKAERQEKSLVPLDHATGGLLGLWNSTVTKLPKAQKLTNGRRQHAAQRLKDEPDLDIWRDAILRLEASSFATGANDRGWRADFDFLLRPDTLTRIREGKYDNRPTPMFATVGKTAGNLAALQAVLSPKGKAHVGH